MSLPLLLVMGVSGAGKSVVGAALATRLGVAFQDADDLHPPANVAKMSRGEPLDDTDRGPWLDLVGGWLAGQAEAGGVVACSALRRAYRDHLRSHAPGLVAVHLAGPRGLVAERLSARRGHFMAPALLGSQLDTLEPLGADEDGVTLMVDRTVEELVEVYLARAGSSVTAS